MSTLARRCSVPPVFALLTGVLVVLVAAPVSSQEPEPRWPREFNQQDGSTLTIYQPQVDEWQNYRRLKARAAVTFKIPGQDQPVIGAIQLTANTETDHEARVVMVDDVEVVKADFPGQDQARARTLTGAVQASVPKKGVDVPLDRILANLERGKALSRQVELSNKPPKIITSRKPAVLVVLDGKPLLEPIEGTDLSTVLNTSADLFRHDKASRYYLLDEDSWLMAEELSGAWIAAGDLPADFRRLPRKPRWAEVRKQVPGKALTGTDVPVVYVREEPTELIVTLGEPQFKPIPGTSLLYVANTESDLFVSGTDGKYYMLVSGRWFRSVGKDMPVEFCTDDLPSDFRKIPEDHTCGRVLVSVPGTQQAQEAIYAAEIPRQAKVERDKVSVEVTYTGEPEFKLIDGTKVECAVNTSFDVFRVGGRYYVCYQAVWFESASPRGPWAVCERVPAEIYQIPASSEKYHVTYVQVYESEPDYVVYGYYPGYYGCYAWGGVVVYGCGYYWHHSHAYYRHCYHHWQHHHHHHWRQTYGRGHYYDHLDGRFRSHHEVRRRAGSKVAANPYRAWGKGVTPRGAGRYAGARTAGARPVAAAGKTPKKAMDLHVGKDGNVYRHHGDGWQRYEKGAWRQVRQPTRRPATPAVRQPTREPTREPTRQPARQPARRSPPTPRRQSTLSRSHRSRSQGARRSSQYRSYRSSRGTRTSGGYRGGGRRGGGGFRGGRR